MCTEKMRALSYIGAEKITFPPKPATQTDRHTDIHTDRRTDISVYRVASLLMTYSQTDIHTDGRTDISVYRVASKNESHW